MNIVYRRKIKNRKKIKMLFSHFRKLDLSNFKMTFAKRLIKKPLFFITDFQNPYKGLLFYHVEIFYSIVVALLHFNIFCVLHGIIFSLLIIISTMFYSDRDINMGRSIFRAIFEENFFFFCTLLAFFMSNIVGNIF